MVVDLKNDLGTRPMDNDEGILVVVIRVVVMVDFTVLEKDGTSIYQIRNTVEIDRSMIIWIVDEVVLSRG